MRIKTGRMTDVPYHAVYSFCGPARVVAVATKKHELEKSGNNSILHGRRSMNASSEKKMNCGTQYHNNIIEF
jgi:hypothetical protein